MIKDKLHLDHFTNLPQINTMLKTIVNANCDAYNLTLFAFTYKSARGNSSNDIQHVEPRYFYGLRGRRSSDQVKWNMVELCLSKWVQQYIVYEDGTMKNDKCARIAWTWSTLKSIMSIFDVLPQEIAPDLFGIIY